MRRKRYKRKLSQNIQLKETKPWFDKYTNIFQIIIIGLTLVTLFYTHLDSKKALQLSTEVFKYSRHLDSVRDYNSSVKDSLDSIRYVHDTTIQGKLNYAQSQRNKHQDVLNSLQLKNNKEQLRALQSQAKASDLQAHTSQNLYLQQQDQYKQQLYEQRPVFNIDSVGVAIINSVLSRIQFYYSNQGIRAAHIDSTLIAFYNPILGCFSVTKNTSNLDLLPLKNFQTTSQINIYQDCRQSDITIYYLLIYYKDSVTGRSQIEPIFFRYNIPSPHQFLWSRVTGPIKEDFVKKLKKKGVFVL